MGGVWGTCTTGFLGYHTCGITSTSITMQLIMAISRYQTSNKEKINFAHQITSNFHYHIERQSQFE